MCCLLQGASLIVGREDDASASVSASMQETAVGEVEPRREIGVDRNAPGSLIIALRTRSGGGAAGWNVRFGRVRIHLDPEQDRRASCQATASLEINRLAFRL